MQVNDVVYFKLEESPLKNTWKLGKIDSVKLGRDKKVREVNVAYRIMKEGLNWEHNVVTRPTREIVKLFELGDTTFAEDIRAVHDMAKKILIEKGEIEADATLNILEWSVLDLTDADEDCFKDPSKSANLHGKFLSCLSSQDWFSLSTEGEASSCDRDEENDNLKLDTYDIDKNDDILFMI